MSTTDLRSGSSLARSDQSSVPELRFVNDWTPLEEAVQILKKEDPYNMDLGEWDCNSAHYDDFTEEAIDTVVKYVPRLIEAYSQLMELSLNMTQAWEYMTQNRTPEGIYIPTAPLKGP